MTTSAVELAVASAMTIAVTEDTLSAELMDGRTISVPLGWYPRLVHATPEERNNWEIHAGGQHLHWPEFGRGHQRGWIAGGTVIRRESAVSATVVGGEAYWARLDLVRTQGR